MITPRLYVQNCRFLSNFGRVCRQIVTAIKPNKAKNLLHDKGAWTKEEVLAR